MARRGIAERLAVLALLVSLTLGVVPPVVWAGDPMQAEQEVAVVTDTPAPEEPGEPAPEGGEQAPEGGEQAPDEGQQAPSEENDDPATSPDDPEEPASAQPASGAEQAEGPVAPATPDDPAAATEDPAIPEESEAAEEAVLEDEADGVPTVQVRAYMQRTGWQDGWTAGGKVAGAAGRGRRVEALRMRVRASGGSGQPAGGVEYRAHVQGEGWQDWAADGATSGSTGKARRIEALQVRLTGELAEQFDVWYRVYVQGIGWMAWAKDGETVGTAGMGLRIEALQVVVVREGKPAPAATNQATTDSFRGTETVRVTAHVQKVGWMPAVQDGKVAGQTGKGRRLEALKVSLVGARVPGGIEVRAHVQGVGWQGWRADGKLAGTAGQKRRVEALRMRLTGEAADAYDLYYRVHVQGMGWLAWAKNGQVAGSEGFYLRIEAVQVRLVPKGGRAPSNSSANYPLPAIQDITLSYASYMEGSGWQSYVNEGATSGAKDQGLRLEGLRVRVGECPVEAGITYRTYLQTTGWQGWRSDNQVSGKPDAGKRAEAVQIKLTGPMASVCSVWYRVYVEGFGWMGWARDGDRAGTAGLSRRIEAIQIQIGPKHGKAPGRTRGAFIGDARSGLSAAEGSRRLTSFGGYVPSARVRNAIQAQINSLRARGYDVGFIVMDLRTYQGICYNCDGMFYAASSIKAPYIFAVVNQNPGVVRSRANDIQQTLFYSSDAHYKAIFATYGIGPMIAWNNASGARASIARNLPWVTCSARDLALMWAHAYGRFNSSAAWRQIAVWCQRPNTSTIHATLSRKYTTRSKGGWIATGGPVIAGINGGGPFWNVTDDAGIVYATNGPYVIAIMSSVPSNHDALNGLTAALDAAHREM